MSDLTDCFEIDSSYHGKTKGTFNTEREAESFVCNSPAVLKWFDVYRQVKANPLFYHPAKSLAKEEYRLDVLLIPKKETIDIGWKSGAIVIECKKSDLKVGPAYSQAFDYVNACTVGMPGGVLTIPSYGLVFMASHEGGPIASLMTQNRFGCAWWYEGTGLWSFNSGEISICSFDEISFKLGKQNAGNKTGSR